MITLQYCVGFCYVSAWISHRRHTSPPSWVFLPSPAPWHLSGLLQSTRFELPVSYSTFPQLSVLHLVMYMFQCCSLSLSILFSPTVSTRLFPECASPRVPYKWAPQCYLSAFHIYALIYDVCFSLCLIGSRFIHLIRTDSNMFLFNDWVIFHCIYVPKLFNPFIFWLLGCFHVPAIVNSTTMNIGVHVSFWIMVSQGICPVVGLLGHLIVLFLLFKGTSILFSIVAALVVL